MEEDPIMEYGKRFRRQMSYSDLAENYDRYKQVLREYAKNIKASSEAKKYIMKNFDKADPLDLLEVACKCIADLTSDSYFKDFAETIKTVRLEDK